MIERKYNFIKSEAYSSRGVLFSLYLKYLNWNTFDTYHESTISRAKMVHVHDLWQTIISSITWGGYNIFVQNRTRRDLESQMLLSIISSSKCQVKPAPTPWPFRPKGIVVACVCPSVRLSVRKFYFVRTIVHHKFELASPNLHQTCIMGYFQLVLKMAVIDLDLQGHSGHFYSEL